MRSALGEPRTDGVTVQLTTLARDGLDDLGLLAVLFDQVADVDDALVVGAGVSSVDGCAGYARFLVSTSSVPTFL